MDVERADVRITAKITDPDGVQSVSLQYQVVEPGDYIRDDDARYNAPTSWTTIPMQDDGQSGDIAAGDDEFSCLIPGTVQTHRRLVRYRITVADNLGASVRVPYADDLQLNFAYFVYDGVPAWTGSRRPGVVTPVTYSSSLLSSVPQYHLITRVADHSNAQYVPITKADGRRITKPQGLTPTDSIFGRSPLLRRNRLRSYSLSARGGVWRFAMGKNMWKFDFNKGHDFAARDNYGKPYGQKWKKLNFSAVIQQGDFNHRGEQGLFESVGFRLFQLTGMPAEHTQFVHFRIIDGRVKPMAPRASLMTTFRGFTLESNNRMGSFSMSMGFRMGTFIKWKAAPEN